MSFVRYVGRRSGGLAVADQCLFLLGEAQVLGKGQGWKHKLGEAAGTRLTALHAQCGSRRPAGDESNVRVTVDQGLEMNLPVLQ